GARARTATRAAARARDPAGARAAARAGPGACARAGGPDLAGSWLRATSRLLSRPPTDRTVMRISSRFRSTAVVLAVATACVLAVAAPAQAAPAAAGQGKAVVVLGDSFSANG